MWGPAEGNPCLRRWLRRGQERKERSVDDGDNIFAGLAEQACVADSEASCALRDISGFDQDTQRQPAFVMLLHTIRSPRVAPMLHRRVSRGAGYLLANRERPPADSGF